MATERTHEETGLKEHVVSWCRASPPALRHEVVRGQHQHREVELPRGVGEVLDVGSRQPEDSLVPHGRLDLWPEPCLNGQGYR